MKKNLNLIFVISLLFSSCMPQEGQEGGGMMSLLPILLIIGIIVIIVVKTRKKQVGKAKSDRIGIKATFAIYGAILGIPLSYYFQPEVVKNKVGGIGGYLQNFGEIVNNSNLLGNIIVSVVVFAIVGGVIGYFVNENEAKKEK